MRRIATSICLALVLQLQLPQSAQAATIERTYTVGIEPFGVTIDPLDGRVYVADSDGGAADHPGVLSVLDPRSDQITNISLASPPIVSALDRTLGRLFVTTSQSALAVVDTATQSVVQTIPGVASLGVAVDDATHVVYAGTVSSLSKLDGATGSVLQTVRAPTNDSWWAVAFDAVFRHVYVTNLNPVAPSLVVLDADDLSVIGNVALPEIPRLALAVDTARQRIYVGGYSSVGALYVVDAAMLAITRIVDLGAGGSWPLSATLAPDGAQLYLSNASVSGSNSGALLVLDLVTLQVTERTLLPWLPGQTAVHPNGRLYVAGFSAQLLAAVLLGNSAPVVDSVTLSP